MLLQTLRVEDFRNLARQRLELASGVNLFVGDNGQGKTNLLEAIHLLASLRSFRPAANREMVRRGAERAELAARVCSHDTPIQLRLVLAPGGRRLWVGQRAVGGVSEFLGQLSAVAFTPDDLSMIKGAPAIRRRFLDRAVFLFRPAHLEAVRRFSSALRARNRLLGDECELDRAQLEAFGRALAEWGGRVAAARRALVDELAEPVARITSDLSGGALAVELAYRPGWEAIAGREAESLETALERSGQRDRRRGATTVGPQLDDFELRLDGASARRFGSQGQQRACAVALLLAVVERVVAAGGEQPVLLLDDVSSELDAGVRRRLFARVTELGGQVLVTTTDAGLRDELTPAAAGLWRVRGGHIEREPTA